MSMPSLNLKFGMDIAEITSGVNKMQKELSKITKSIQDTQKAVLTGFAALGTAALFGKIVEGAKDAQDAMAQVESAIRSTGGAAGITAKEVDELANALKRKTGIDDDQIKSMQAVMLTFTRINKEIFPETTSLILDMSKRMGGDMQAAAVQVGKALNDPIKGMTALQKVGVSFSESQKAVVKQLVESGHVLEAQKMILSELKTEFGGAAAAARDTLGGAIQALKQNLDDLLDSFGATGSKSGGLRFAIELANTLIEDLTDFISAASDPTNKLGKEFVKFGGIISEVWNTTKAWINGYIYLFQMAWDKTVAFANNVVKVVENIKSTVSKFTFGLSDLFAKLNPGKAAGDALGKGILDAFADTDKKLKAGMKDGSVPNYFKGIDDAIAKTKTRMAELAAAAASYKGPKADTAYGETAGQTKEKEKAAKAAAKAHEKYLHQLETERQKVASIVQAGKDKLGTLQDQLDATKGITEQAKIERQIMAESKVPLEERKAAIEAIRDTYKQIAEVDKQIKIFGEREKLKEVLADIKRQNEELDLKKNKQEELIPLQEAEARIREIVKLGMKETADVQREIRDAAAQTVDKLKEAKHEEALKNLKAISDEMDKQINNLNNKIRGEEELNGLYEQEKKIKEDINLSEKEKNDALNDLRDKYKEIQRLNEALDEQQKVLDKIKNTGLNYKQQVEALNQALKDSRINTKQYNDALNDLNNQQEKAKNIAGDFARSFTNAFSGLITGSKNFKSSLVDLGKEVANLAAKHLLLAPLEKFLTNLGVGLFGGKGATGTAGAGSAPGATPASSGGFLGGLLGKLPILGSMLGGASGLGGLSSGGPAGAAATSGLLSLGNMLSKQLGAPGFFTALANNAVQGGGPGSVFGLAKSFGFGPLASGMFAGAAGIGGTLGTLGRIFGFATGGHAQAGTPFMAGENGAELIVPAEDLHIFTALQTAQIMQSMAMMAALSGGGGTGGAPQTEQIQMLGGYSVRTPSDQAFQMQSFSVPTAEAIGYSRAGTEEYQRITSGQADWGKGIYNRISGKWETNYQQANLDRIEWVKNNIYKADKAYEDELRKTTIAVAQRNAQKQLQEMQDQGIEHWSSIQLGQIARGNFGPYGGLNETQIGFASGDNNYNSFAVAQQDGIPVSDDLLRYLKMRDEVTRISIGNSPDQPISDGQAARMVFGGGGGPTSFGDGTGGASSVAYGASAFNDNGTWNRNSGANYYEDFGGYALGGGADAFWRTQHLPGASQPGGKNITGSGYDGVKNTGIPQKNFIPFGENPYGIPPFLSPTGPTGAFPLPDGPWGGSLTPEFADFHNGFIDNAGRGWNWSDQMNDANYYMNLIRSKPLPPGASYPTGLDPALQATAGKLPGYAMGGRPEVGLPALVGENGPEIFVPDTAGRVIPNHQLGGQAPTVHIHHRGGPQYVEEGRQYDPQTNTMQLFLGVVAHDLANGGVTSKAQAAANRRPRRG